MTEEAKLVLVQCQDSRRQREWRLKADLDGKTISGYYGYDYNFKLVDTGPRAGNEIFRANFKVIQKSDSPMKAIEHVIAARIAQKYARKCGATSTEAYPQAKDGILGLWRGQIDENLTTGHFISSDENHWTLGLYLSEEVDRNSLLAYLTDDISGLQFRFIFPGSSKFCKAHADNTIHGDAPCDLDSEGRWDAGLSPC